MNLEAGVKIGDFRIEKRLGAGGMGIVYLARQLSLNRLVALKVLGSALTDQTDIARFQREAQAVAKLSHPGIAGIHFVGQDKEICYIAMEYIDGISVRELMRKLVSSEVQAHPIDDILQATSVGGDAPVVRYDGPTLPYPPAHSANDGPLCGGMTAERVKDLIASPDYIRQCCEIVRDAAIALAHAHDRGVIHRDIKPENILLDRQGNTQLIDFGLARFYEDATLTSSGALVGTPMYMSPEQVTGRIELDHRTDIYSLGLVLYEMLTLAKPFSSPTRDGILRQIVTKAMIPLGWKNKAVSRDLESVVHKVTAKDPDERYDSALALADDLACMLSNRPIAAKPYRYKFDGREIAAERPREIIYYICIMICLSIAGVFFSLQTLSIYMDKRIYMTDRTNPIFALLMLPIFVGIFMLAVWVLAGHRSAINMLVLLVILSLIYVYYLYNDNRYDYWILAIWLPPSLLIPLLYRRPVRVWLSFCEQIRLEHKRLKGSVR